MRGGAIGSICFLAFLIFQNTNGQNILTTQNPLSDSNDEVAAEKSAASVITNSGESTAQVPKVEARSSIIEDEDATDTNDNVSEENPNGFFHNLRSGAPSSRRESNEQLKTTDDAEDEIEDKSGFSFASASGNGFAQAISHSDSGGLPQNLGNPFGSLYPNLASSSAQAFGNAQAMSSTGSSPFPGIAQPMAPSNPFMGLGSSLSAADALAQANSGGWSPYGPSYGSSFAQAQAQAQAQADAGRWNPFNFGLGDSSYASAAAQALANSGGWNPYGSGFNPGLSYASAESQASSIALYSPGQSDIQCSYPGEMYSMWSIDHKCLICACQYVLFDLVPVCVGCDSCAASPIPEPIPEPIPIPPLPPPESQVSCSPLPQDTPFQNPLNPCQVCVCSQVFNPIGQPDVFIECQDIPQCAPIPVPPQPVPMPLCENFPPNVPFPHPYEACQICECVVEFLSFGIPEQRIICIPSPECEEFPPFPEPIEPWPFPEPLPEPWPLPPIPEPFPFPEPIQPIPEPFPFPEPIQPIPEPFPLLPEPLPPIPEPFPPIPEPWPIPEPIQPMPEPFPPIPEWPVPEPWIPQPEPIPLPIPAPEPEPLPWPPLIPDLPPSPLPGPPPHRSCRPYPPNQQFQHPWDECQVCVCSEYYDVGVINIEVNCYTKPTCCLELPFPEPRPEPYPLLPYQPLPEPILPPIPDQGLWPLEPFPQIPEPTPNQSCQYQAIGAEFISPEDICKICTCEQFGIFVAPVCRRSSRPEYVPLIQPYGSYGSAEASASALANAYGFGQSSAFAQAESEASAFANAASSEAVAIADALSQLNPNLANPQFLEGLSSTTNQYPFGVVFPGSNTASAESTANAQSSLMNISPFTNGYPYYGDTSGLVQPQSPALTVPNYTPTLPTVTQSPYTMPGSYSSAEAIANSQASSYFPGIYGNYPLYPGLTGLGQNAQAQSNAIAGSQLFSGLAQNAQAQSNAFAGSQLYPGLGQNAQAQTSAIAATQLYPSLYQYQLGKVTGLYQPGIAGWDNSALLGQLGGGASAQSLAQVSTASGRPLIRSGPGLCKYSGDKYHHNCQACFCFKDRGGIKAILPFNQLLVRSQLTPSLFDDTNREHINLAAYGDAEHRGQNWYAYESQNSGESGSYQRSRTDIQSSSLSSGSGSVSSSLSSEASSIETKERRRATKTYRQCTPCPQDMMKKYTNFGIKWICAAYQRARRSFKSECMMRYRNCQDGTIHLTNSLQDNTTIKDIENDLKEEEIIETRRRIKDKRKDRSTSSSSGHRLSAADSRADVDDSLELLSSSDVSTEEKKHPKSSVERRGWRKWHRKCPTCPEDMVKKWNDPSIMWICGGYQRARRSFKSTCMMHYRNCQDGTMFVKIHDNRCANSTREMPHGLHFFYDYKVASKSSKTEDSTLEDSSSSI
ncbi:unnamed protein product [Colias eurytheme]|nr:unnamed protein product [Colias eurytheme]